MPHFTLCFWVDTRVEIRKSGEVLHRGSQARGFTLVELVTVIMVVGILAAIVTPRFVGTDTFSSRAFYDQATGVIRYAQKTAIAWRNTAVTPVFVCITANSVSAGKAAGCATLLTNPVTGAPLTATAPSGVTLSPAVEFSFDGLGRPSAGQKTITVTSTIAGDPARKIVVEAETGYVHH